jgi:hypothetical protein
MDEQAKINKDAVTKFEGMEKIFENIGGKVTEVGGSIREVFNMMKMLETQVGQLVGHPMVLTPKNATGERLTCGPSLVMKYYSARKNLLRGIGKGCLRSAMRHLRQKDCLRF